MSLARLEKRNEHARVLRDVAEALSEADLHDITAARRNVHLLLVSHNLITAAFAVKRDPGCQSFLEYHAMVSHMRAGGFHRVRRTGGRGLDG
jgi:hypothetical protein